MNEINWAWESWIGSYFGFIARRSYRRRWAFGKRDFKLKLLCLSRLLNILGNSDILARGLRSLPSYF